ncbi:hypothetical protein ACB094_06G133900 [Castanea mollissima]
MIIKGNQRKTNNLKIKNTYGKKFYFMGQENPRISFGQKERESGLTSCGDEWVVPKSPLLPSGKSEMMTQIQQKKTSCLALGENDPQHIKDNCEFSLNRVWLHIKHIESKLLNAFT